MLQDNIKNFNDLIKIIQFYAFAVGAVKVFFTCMFLITARLGVSLRAGIKEKLKDNWPVIAVFLAVSLIAGLIWIGVWWFIGKNILMSGRTGRVISYLSMFVLQYFQYVLIPFVALPFVVVPSEKTN
jgi:hypothetical protein